VKQHFCNWKLLADINEHQGKRFIHLVGSRVPYEETLLRPELENMFVTNLNGIRIRCYTLNWKLLADINEHQGKRYIHLVGSRVPCEETLLKPELENMFVTNLIGIRIRCYTLKQKPIYVSPPSNLSFWVDLVLDIILVFYGQVRMSLIFDVRILHY